MKMLSERGGRQAGVGVMLARGVIRDNRACWGDVTALPGAPRVQVARPRSQQGQLPGPRVWVGQAGELILTHLDTQWFVDLYPHPARKLQKMLSEPTAPWICWRGFVVGRRWLLLQKPRFSSQDPQGSLQPSETPAPLNLPSSRTVPACTRLKAELLPT